MSRPKELKPYHAYHIKDNSAEFDFVCIKPSIQLYKDLSSDLLTKIMYINYNNPFIGEWFFLGSPPQCGDIDNYKIYIRLVRYINNKTERIQNAIKLAKLMTM